MSETPLSRYAGQIVLAAGVGVVCAHAALLVALGGVALGVDEATEALGDPLVRTVSIIYAATFPLLVIALAAANERQARQAGSFGFIAFCAAIIGTLSLGANMWFEALAVPWLIEVSPELLSADKSTYWVVGYLSSYVLFACGWLLFGLAMVRAGVFPRWVGIVIAAGGAIGFLAARPPFAVPLGLALVCLGVWLVRTKRPSSGATHQAEGLSPLS